MRSGWPTSTDRTPGACGDIYTIAPAGNPPRRVTRGRADDGIPVWSPGGTRIAFRRGRPGRRQLFVVKPNGHRLRRLTSTRRGVTGPAWSPNGRRIAFGLGRRGHRALAVIRTNGRGLRRLVRGSADIRSIEWQPRGVDPVVAAAGDVACDPTAASFRGGLGTSRSCHMRGTSDLLLKMDLWAVLLLGDVQYDNGEHWKFIQSFHQTWGRIKSVIRPALGNHEYGVPGAAAYFDYFNRPELRSGSPQERWLRADLAAQPRACTLAYWHHPLASSRLGVDEAVRPLWQTLADAGVDVVLTGQDHSYERFRPLDRAGAADFAGGIRQFVVGTGGKSHQRAAGPLSVDSEIRDSETYGVLRLQLRRRSYHWSFVSEADQVVDRGAQSCH